MDTRNTWAIEGGAASNSGGGAMGMKAGVNNAPSFQDAKGLPMAFDVSSRFAAQSQNFSITGTDSGVVTVNIAPGQYIDCEPGAMVYQSPNIKIQAKIRGCCAPATIGGEGQFKTRLVNDSDIPGYAGVANPTPGVVVPIDLGKYDRYQGILLARDSWFASIPGPNGEKVHVGWEWPPNATCAQKCCGGTGLIMQKLSGPPGTYAFATANGTILEQQLGPGEEMVVEDRAILGFTPGVRSELTKVGGCMMCCLGGQGCFNTKVIGPGTVWLQSMSIHKLRQVVGQEVAQQQAKENAAGQPAESDMTR